MGGREGSVSAQWADVTGALEEVRTGFQGRCVAVFDADGTLWGDDLGERHLRVLDARGLVTASSGHGSVVEEYEARCIEDTEAGYAWAVSCMEGMDEGDVIGTSVLAWAAHRHLVPNGIRELLTWLERHEIEVWLVSASNRWAVETAAAELGVPAKQVIAMSVDVVEGRLGGEVHRPLSNGAGKAELIDQRIGVVPLLAVGNSRHDMAMLEQAQLGVVVRLAGEDGELPPACPALQEAARTQGWFERDLRWGGDEV